MKENFLKDFSKRIDFVCKKMGSAGRLSKETGISMRAISSYRNAESDPSRGNLIAIANAAKVDIAWLAAGNGTEESIKQIPIQSSNATIAMKGFAQCGLNGWFNEFDTGQEFTFSIPDMDAFAVMAIGLSMLPASINQGSICIVSPNSSINLSDIVYVEKNDGTSSIKKLVSQDEKWITLQGWLDPDITGQQQPYTDQINRSVINKIHPILWIKSKPM